MQLETKNTVILSKSEVELRSGSIPKLFRKFAIPGVVGLLFLGIQTIIDGIVLGNYVGANALASVSLIMPCYSLIAAISVVIGIGSQTLVSINLGELNRQGANNAMASGIIFVTGLAVVIGSLLFIIAPQIATLLGANDVLISDSVSYMRALVPFFPVLAVMFYCDYMLKALGNPIYAMAVMSSTVIINILLDLLFIAQWDMGTHGAGLATGISFTCGMLCSLPIVLSERKKINIFKGKYNWKLVWQMLYNGSSEGLSELSAGITILLFNVTMMKYLGESGVAAFTALEYILFVFITIYLGVSDGIVPIVSYNYGADNWLRIKKVLGLALRTNLIIGICVFLALTIFGRDIVTLFFRSGETSVVDIAAHGTVIYAFAFLFNGLNILASSYFTAIANAKISVIISSLRGIIFVVPAVIFLPEILGIKGVWIAIPMAEVMTLIVSIILVRRSFKKISKTI